MNLNKHILLIMIAGLCFVAKVDAQSYHAFSGELYAGKVVKHKKGLSYEVPPVTTMIQLGYVQQTDGSKPWHHYWNFPRLEKSMHIKSFGDADILGYAIGAAPGVGFYIKRWHRSALIMHINAGFAYLTKEYSPISNPTNNAIGSNFNNTTQLKFSFETPISTSLMLDLGFGITHYSNGLNSSPNSGINTAGLHIGIKGLHANRALAIHLESPPAIPSFKRWGLNAYTTYAVAEYIVPGGPKYPIKNYSFGMYYARNPFIRWHLGIDYEYHYGKYEFAIRDFQTEQVARDIAISTPLFLGIEALFGDFSFRYQMGYYVSIISHRNDDVPYSKLNISYYLPFEYAEVRPFVGLLLKTHVAVAEYAAIQVGINW